MSEVRVSRIFVEAFEKVTRHYGCTHEEIETMRKTARSDLESAIKAYMALAEETRREQPAGDDDRRHCSTCGRLEGSKCGAYKYMPCDIMPRRCLEYRPLPGDEDRRNGRQRWPFLEEKDN